MKELLFRLLKRFNINISHKYEKYLQSIYNNYKDCTMIPKELYLDNLNLCLDFYPGDGAIVECGVWRGGMIAGIAKALKNFNNSYYLFDSFEGLPKVKEIDGERAKEWQMNTASPFYYDNCRAEFEYAEKLFLSLDVEFKIIKGWFNETLPLHKPSETISILRLDADWYESTKICLEILFPLVKQNGIVIIDDYYTWDGCSRAVHEYFNEIKSSSRIHQTRLGTAYIIKNEAV